jgi:membrane fusion protein (multidrug efflux system)
MPDAVPPPSPPPAPVVTAPAVAPPSGSGWFFPLLRVLLVVLAGFMAWYVAGNWNRWTGAARYETTNDAFMVGDLTPLSSKVSGYVSEVTVGDYQVVHKGDVLARIDPSDYHAQLAQAEANVAVAQATLANLKNQRDVQGALVRQAAATIQATSADVTRYGLEARRQRDLLQTRIAGTPQLVEQADANEKRVAAQLMLNVAQLDQQNALLKSLDVQQEQLEAQLRSAEAQAMLARNNLGYTEIASPADGMVGARQVRPGQFVNVGTQVIAVMPLPGIWVIANYKETQMTNLRIGQRAKVTVDAFPGLALTGRVESWSPGTGSTFALLAPDNATGNFTKVVQRLPVKIVLDPSPSLGTIVRPGMSVVATVDTEAAAEPTPASTEKTTK